MAISAQLSVSNVRRETTRKVYNPKGGKRESLPRMTARQMRQFSDRVAAVAGKVDRSVARFSDRVTLADRTALCSEEKEQAGTTRTYRRRGPRSDLLRHLYRAGLCLLVGLLTLWPVSANFRSPGEAAILGFEPILFSPSMLILVVPLALWCLTLFALAGHQLSCAFRSLVR